MCEFMAFFLLLLLLPTVLCYNAAGEAVRLPGPNKSYFNLSATFQLPEYALPVFYIPRIAHKKRVYYNAVNHKLARPPARPKSIRKALTVWQLLLRAACNL